MFTHLHIHSEYSVLDGMCRVNEIVDRVKELGQDSVAITDHGHLGNVPEFYSYARKQGINPIIGQEFYIVPDASVHDKENRYFHIILMARNVEGFHVLCELSTLASDPDNFYYKPRIDWRMLKEYSNSFDNIIALTGCLRGEVPYHIIHGKPKRAERILNLYRVLFPHLYLEFQKHKTDNPEFTRDQRLANIGLLGLAKKYDLPMVLTNDVHYVKKGDDRFHEVLLAIQTKTTMENERRFKFDGADYYIKDEQEMMAMFPKLWRVFSKTIRQLAKGVYIDIPELNTTTWHVPQSNLSDDPPAYLRKACLQWLKERIPKEQRAEYLKVLNYQLGVIREANFEEEFLIVKDYVDWARRQGISVSPGRGSMAGVLPSYLTGIVDIDPIRFKLMFERAINPARPTLPDFDIDFDKEGRLKVVDYLKEKYGEDNVMFIGTFLRFGPRSILGRVMKVLGFDFQTQQHYTKLLPDSLDITTAKSTGDMIELLELASGEFQELLEAHPEIAEYCLKFQGLISSMGTHAAGVIISDSGRPLKKFMPTILIKEEGNAVSQYDMDGLKKFGFVKFDILSLKTLSIIRETIRLVGTDEFNRFPDGFGLDDQKVFDTINNGFLKHVFQLEGYANRAAMKTIGGIENFEDIVSIISIARPGTNQFIPEFAENKKHPENKHYFSKRLRRILGPTHGVLLLQEQVMEIAKVFAGFDDIKVDDMKETIKAKNPEKFKSMRPVFIGACIEHGVKEKHAEELWAIIENAAGYLYNRAHAVSYSSVAYLTAHLKTYYPNEYYLSMLRFGVFNDFKSIVDEARRFGIKFAPVDIFESGLTFEVGKNGRVRYGLSNIKYIGIKMAERIIALRKEKGDDLVMEDIRALNIGVYKHLLASGALKNMGGEKPDTENDLFYHGVKIYTDELRGYRGTLRRYMMSKSNLKRMSGSGKQVVIGGIVNSVTETFTRRGHKMLFVSLKLDDAQYRVTLFPQMVKVFGDKLQEGRIVMVLADHQPDFNSYVPHEVEVLK